MSDEALGYPYTVFPYGYEIVFIVPAEEALEDDGINGWDIDWGGGRLLDREADPITASRYDRAIIINFDIIHTTPYGVQVPVWLVVGWGEEIV